MQLYLSSYRLGNHVADLRDMVGSDSTFALVPNALDFIDDPKTRQAVIDRGMNDLTNEGFAVQVIDLRDYFGKPSLLHSELQKYNRLFVTGGNVFVLRRAMEYSGLDEFVIEQKGNESFIYASYSAGSCICSPTLEGFHLVDDPAIVPKGYGSAYMQSGLSLILETFIPHYRSDHHESNAIERVVEYCRASNLLFRGFRDGEVLLQAAERTQQSGELDVGGRIGKKR